MWILFSSKHHNSGLEATVSVSRKGGKLRGEKVSLAGIWVQKQAHQHLVLQLNFTASLWCHWWELSVFTRKQPVRRVSPARLRLSWQSQALSGGIKISIYQDSTEAVWGVTGEMAHSRPLPAVGLWWRVQHAGMCPCRLFLDSMCDVRKKSTLIPASHFVSLCLSAVPALAMSWMWIVLWSWA